MTGNGPIAGRFSPISDGRPTESGPIMFGPFGGRRDT